MSTYMDNTSPDTTYTLTLEEMANLGVVTRHRNDSSYLNYRLGIDIRGGRRFDEYRNLLTGENHVDIKNMFIPLRATQGRTLGIFAGFASGRLSGCTDTWSFEGTIRFWDNWDLTHNPGADSARNLHSFLGRNLIPGTEFQVRSVDAPLTQNYTNKAAQWAGGRRTVEGPGLK